VSSELGLVFLVLSFLVSGLAFGAQHTPVLLVAVALAIAAAVFAPADLPMPRLAWLLVAFAAFSLIQALPLPFGLVHALSPAAADVWAGALRPLGEGRPGWVSLSVDPASTWLEVVKYSGYACLVIAAAGVRSRRGSPAVVAAIFVAAVAVCVVTLAHGALNASRIYGMFTPPDAAVRWTRGPFVNGNNLAGYLNLGLFAGVGLWLGGRSPIGTAPLSFGIPLLALGVMLGGSRGGVLALVIAGMAVVGHALTRKSTLTPRVITGAGVVLLVASGGFIVLGDARLRGSLSDGATEGKLAGFRWTLDMILDHAWLGVGRGAFDGAFQPYRGVRGDASTVLAHAENVVLDWVSEWGLPLGVLALVATGWFVARLVGRAKKDTTTLGLAAGVLALLLQNQVDFGLELFAIGSLFWTALVMANGANAANERQSRFARFVPIGAAVVAGIVVLAMRANPLHVERRAMKQRFTEFDRAGGRDTKELGAALRRAVLQHPGDGYLPLLGGHLASREHKNPLRWFGRALERNPTSGRANLALGEALGSARHEEQALIHLRLAAAYDYELADRALNLAVAFAPSVPALASGFPEGALGASAFVDLCPKLQPHARIECFREALRRDPRDKKAHEALASELFDALEARRAPCAGAEEAACALEAERSVTAASPGTGYRTLVLGARLRARKGDRLGAVGMLLSGCPATPTAAACLELAADLAVGLPDTALARQAEDRFVALACELPARCAAAHAHVGDRLEAAGELDRALGHFTAAAREAPSAGRWLKVADLAARTNAFAAKRAALAALGAFGDLTDAQRREVLRLSNEPVGGAR
jgi:hypothetical protein